MMALTRLGYIIAVRRIVLNWRLELVLFAGILLAVSLMASGVIFSNLLAETALRHAMTRATPQEANFWIRIFTGQDTAATAEGRTSYHRATQAFNEQRVLALIDSHVNDRAMLIETSTFFFTGHPQLELDNEVRPRGEIKYMTALTSGRAEIVRGRWPYSDPAAGSPKPGEPLQVAVDVLGSQLLQLDVGDRLEAFPAASFTDPPSIPVEIVGVFKRVNVDAEFWYASNNAFSFHDDKWTIVPLFTSEGAILGQVYDQYPTLYTDVTWFYYVDRPTIDAGNVDQALDSLRRIQRDVRTNLANSSNGIKLDEVLEDYQEQLLLARIPLYLILFLIIGTLAYYLALITALIIKSRATEISVLKSRGATTVQVAILSAVEGVLLAVPAVVIGPFLALAVVTLLGRVFFGLGSSGELTAVPLSIPTEAFLVGLAGGVLGVVVLTGTTLVAARQSVVEFRQTGARPPSVPFVHRYYLDILLLGLIALFWWQIQSRGAFLVRSLGNQGLEIDYTLLLGPLLGLLAIGLVVMRVFPIAIGVLTRLAEPAAPSWLLQGLRHVSRDPVVPGALVVLLMFATALGVIGSAFSATLERSQMDRALYAAGADLRIEHGGKSTPRTLQGISEAVKAEGLAEVAIEAQRAGGHLTTTGFSTSGIMLAVEADDFDRVAWFRPDFSQGQSLEELTALLTPEPSPENQGVVLPMDATTLTVLVQPSRPDRSLFVHARLMDALGYYFDVSLGSVGFRGWKRLEGNIVPVDSVLGLSRPDSVTYPVTLMSLQLAHRSPVVEPGAIFFGELGYGSPDGGGTLDDFSDLSGWQTIEDFAKPGLYSLEASDSVAPPGSDRSARFGWAPGSIGLRGIRPGAIETPVPALVSKRFLEIADAKVGDLRTVGLSTFSLALEIKAAVDYFPTLDPDGKPFSVVDLETFIRHANMHSTRPVGWSNEVWVDLDSEGAAPDAIIGKLEDSGLRVRDVFKASDLVSQRVEQPLVNAGWGALLVLMFLALVLASVSGIVLFSFIDTRERQTEFALLRTLGSSRTQLNGCVWFSLVLVAVCGVSLGTVAGLVIGTSLLPLMEVAEEGVRVTPNMVLQTNWSTLGLSYLVLAVFTVAALLWLVWFTTRMEIHQVLRIGEG